MSFAQQIIDDLQQAVEIERTRAFQAGRLEEREAAFDARQEAYGRGVLDTEARIIKLLEEHFDNPEGCPCDLCWKFAGTKLMTALIKGEK